MQKAGEHDAVRGPDGAHEVMPRDGAVLSLPAAPDDRSHAGSPWGDAVFYCPSLSVANDFPLEHPLRDALHLVAQDALLRAFSVYPPDDAGDSRRESFSLYRDVS